MRFAREFTGIRAVASKTRNKSARPPERDYSHRSRLDKLGVKPEQRIALLGIRDGSFLKELGMRAKDVSVDHPRADCDLIFYAAEDKKDLARLETLAASIRKNGAIWVVYPKGQSHIREVDVIGAGKGAGLVDNKVVGFSDTHTALRLVIPLSKR
jgi:hypothetical protein